MDTHETLIKLQKSANPFVFNSILKNKEYIRNIVETQNNESIDYLVEDPESYVKVFTGQDQCNIVFSMEKNAIVLCAYLPYILTYNSDVVHFSEEILSNILKETGFTLDEFYIALSDLIRVAILSNTPYKDFYWLNPKFMFYGDRIEKYFDGKLYYENNNK